MSDITKWSNFETISKLDPLEFDGMHSQLIEINTRNDSTALIDQYEEMVQRALCLMEDDIDTDSAVAALRDLDFVIGSLLKQGEESLLLSEPSQRALGSLALAAGTVPRGTVYTYAACNPDDNRRRSYTGSQDEFLFIDAVKEGVNALDACADDLTTVLHDGSRLGNASQQMGRLVTSIVKVKRGMTPGYFTDNMRPFFNSLRVNGEKYAGPGGAQMQVVAIDSMLWGLGCKDEVYLSYFKDNIKYLTPNQREQLNDFGNATDGRSITALLKSGDLSPELVAPTIDLLRTLQKFRHPHRKVASDNFNIRSEGAVGSGNYTPVILDDLMSLNKRAISELEQIL